MRPFQCIKSDQKAVRRVISLWGKNNVFPAEIVELLKKISLEQTGVVPENGKPIYICDLKIILRVVFSAEPSESTDKKQKSKSKDDFEISSPPSVTPTPALPPSQPQQPQPGYSAVPAGTPAAGGIDMYAMAMAMGLNVNRGPQVSVEVPPVSTMPSWPQQPQPARAWPSPRDPRRAALAPNSPVGGGIPPSMPSATPPAAGNFYSPNAPTSPANGSIYTPYSQPNPQERPREGPAPSQPPPWGAPAYQQEPPSMHPPPLHFDYGGKGFYFIFVFIFVEY